MPTFPEMVLGYGAPHPPRDRVGERSHGHGKFRDTKQSADAVKGAQSKRNRDHKIR